MSVKKEPYVLAGKKSFSMMYQRHHNVMLKLIWLITVPEVKK